MPEPRGTSGQPGRHQGPDWLQVPAWQPWQQAVIGYRQHTGSAVRCRYAGPDLGHRHYLYQDAGRLRMPGRRHQPLLPPRRRLVNAEPPDDGRRPASIAHGRLAQEAKEQGAGPF